MIVEEILHTCSNSYVASAAVASIGGEFADRFSRVAARGEMSKGTLAAQIVRGFSERASTEQRDAVRRAAHGSDHPILSGLHYILAQSA